MEVSVSFTDGTADLNAGKKTDDEEAYIVEETVLGRVWIPREGLIVTYPAGIRYEKRPWITQFEFDGIRPAPAKRKGIGTKGAKAFVRSLSTIYSGAYDNYRRFGGDEAFDVEAYFAHVAEHFEKLAVSGQQGRIVRKFCGFTENMWREGDAAMLGICMKTLLPMITAGSMKSIFEETITDEFRSYITEGGDLNGCGKEDQRITVHSQ